LAVRLRIQPQLERFPAPVELALYRILQEALTNIEKHAEATEVILELNCDESFVTLKVRDNGRGLPHTQAGPTKGVGMGLSDMKERCAFLSGTFAITSDPHLGTEIAARLPMISAEANRVP
jgi:two-component system, NarL family, sensor kinase